jgi:hypothetical protein
MLKKISKTYRTWFFFEIAILNFSTATSNLGPITVHHFNTLSQLYPMNRLIIREPTDSYGSLLRENTFNVFLNMAVLPNYLSTYPTCITVPPTEYGKAQTGRPVLRT